MTIIVDPGGNGLPMTEMWAWVTVHSNDEQSITALGGLPLIAQQEAALRRVAPLLRDAVRTTGKPQRLVRFHRVETIVQLDP